MSENLEGLRACLLIYDIPERSGIANPSRRLRRLAVRINLSCWVIPEGDIPYNLLNGMRERGAVWHSVPFDPRAARLLVAMAVDSIRKDIRRAIATAKRRQLTLERRADEAQADGNREEYDRFRRDASAVVSRLRRLMKDYQQVAARFGIEHNQIGLGGAMTAIGAIKAGMNTRARQYAEAINELAKLRGDSDAMVRVARADQAHPLVLADYVEEAGGNGQSLREAFGDIGFDV